MPKDWPEFKSWKKLERKKLAKISTGGRWWGLVGRERSGELCNGCRVEICWKSKKGPRSPRSSALLPAIPFYERVFCPSCFRKEIKKAFIFWAKFFAFVIVFGVVSFLIVNFWVKK